VRQIKKITRTLKKHTNDKYDISQYVHTLSKIKTKPHNKKVNMEDSVNFLSNAKNQKEKENIKKESVPLYSLNSNRKNIFQSSKYTKHNFKVGNRTKKNIYLNCSDNKIKSKIQENKSIIQNRILSKNFLKDINSLKAERRLKQNNKSMILYREIDEWQRNLRSSIPTKKKNNTGYPRIKLNVFLDQINK